MTVLSEFQDGFNELVAYGQQIRVQQFNIGFGAGSYYDDDATLTLGSTYWTSGLPLSIRGQRGSNEAVLLEQGKLLTDDRKLYIAGDIDVSGTIKIGLGSGPTEQYSILSEGVRKWDINEIGVMKKVYIRKLLTGSLTGEAS